MPADIKGGFRGLAWEAEASPHNFTMNNF